PAGTVIARNFTEYDYSALKDNIEDLDASKETPAGAQAKADAALAAAKQYTDQEVGEVSQALDAHLAETALDNPHGILDRYKGFQVIVQGIVQGIAIDIDLPNQERPYLYITGRGASSMYLLRVAGAPEVAITPVVESPYVT